ncbi:MAG: hypothetical protein QOI08_1051, partial [Actinomycetota bacterium]|nr:hypothetical protein [Actinomycetota bacterium]
KQRSASNPEGGKDYLMYNPVYELL